MKNQLIASRRERFIAPTKLTVSEWAEQYRVLPNIGPVSGQWSNSTNPILTPILDAISDKNTRKITLQFASQLGKSEVLLNALGYYLHQDPSSILLVQPNQNLSESFSKERVGNLISLSPELNNLINPHHSTITHIEFKNGALLDIVSAGSPADLSSRPKKVVILDEVDRMLDIPGEGCPIKLASQRAINFHDHKIILASTPTLEDSSKIHTHYLEGSQEQYHVPCPDCGALQVLEWAQVRFVTKEDLSTTHYVCRHCDSKWDDYTKSIAISKGQWIAANNKAKEDGHRSFHANALYSPFVSLEYLMSEFLQAKDSPATLQTFVNLKLANVWKRHKTTAPDHTRLFERRKPITQKFKYTTLGVDIQANRIEAQLLGFDKHRQTYVLDYAVFYNISGSKSDFDQLAEYISQKQPTMTCIDSGFRTSEVYAFASKYSPQKLRIIKGYDKLRAPFKLSQPIDPPAGAAFAHNIWLIGSSYMKESVYSMLSLTEDKPNYIHFSSQLDEGYFKGLTAEELQSSKKGYIWVKIHPLNEPLDTFSYAYTAMLMSKINQLKPESFEDNQPQTLINKPTPPPKPKKAPPPLFNNPYLNRYKP